MSEPETIKITFKSVLDFRNRIATIFQNQKEGQIYEFEFLCEDARKEFEELTEAFDV